MCRASGRSVVRTMGPSLCPRGPDDGGRVIRTPCSAFAHTVARRHRHAMKTPSFETACHHTRGDPLLPCRTTTECDHHADARSR